MPDTLLPPCLDDLQVQPWGTHLWLARCRYQPDAFASEHFQASGVTCPASLTEAVAKRRTEYLAGRVCARAAMAAAGADGEPPALGADRSPAWPARVVGTITHAQGRAAALVGSANRWRGLGLDAENWLPPARATRLSRELLTATERHAVGALDQASQARRVTLTFSVKESLFKALYPLTQRRFYFQDAALDGDQIVLLTALSPAWPAGTRLPFHWREEESGVLSWIAIPRE